MGYSRFVSATYSGTSAFHELNVALRSSKVCPESCFSLDAANRMAVWGARKFYHLPY